MQVCQIHERLPAGGILIFLSGQTDIMDLVTRLKAQYTGTLPVKRSGAAATASASAGPGLLEEFDGELSDPEDEEEAEVSRKKLSKGTPEGALGPLHVLPLFSALSSKEQQKVFQAPPEGHRLCIVATNVAETSLTIPGIRCGAALPPNPPCPSTRTPMSGPFKPIHTHLHAQDWRLLITRNLYSRSRYVVDSGQVKNRHYDQTTGVVSYEVEWVSQASANQRSGRAGRTGPGHAYRLYSSAVFQHDFPEFAEPEIKRMPVDGLVLHMKSMEISKVVNFPFPTPPDTGALRKAEKLLVLLGALDKTTKQITRLGKTMSEFAVAPRFAKMLCLSRHYDCHRFVLALDAFPSTSLGICSHLCPHPIACQ
jgi:ATP-dependent RNA helicase DHX37/DHR1